MGGLVVVECSRVSHGHVKNHKRENGQHWPKRPSAFRGRMPRIKSTKLKRTAVTAIWRRGMAWWVKGSREANTGRDTMKRSFYSLYFTGVIRGGRGVAGEHTKERRLD